MSDSFLLAEFVVGVGAENVVGVGGGLAGAGVGPSGPEGLGFWGLGWFIEGMRVVRFF